jgi:hypothetical protein
MRSARAVRAAATPRWPRCSPPESSPASKVLSFGAFIAGPRGCHAPVAALFAAGILSRLEGPVLWCLHSRDLFTPALARVGLHPDRVIYCKTWKDAEILPSMEEGLRHPGVAGVVGELGSMAVMPSMKHTAELAAEPRPWQSR